MQLHLRPSEEKAARCRKPRFEAGCGGWVRERFERVGLDECVSPTEYLPYVDM